MTGDEVREVFEAILPQEEIDRLCPPYGVIERQLSLGMFVRAMVTSAGTPGGAYQADVLRSYVECRCLTWHGPRALGGSTRPWNGAWRRWLSGLRPMRRRHRSIWRARSLA
jgi:hypothetical protein